MKTAVVTGCSSGIGAAVSAIFLHNKFTVYGISRTDPSINDPHFHWMHADLYNPMDIRKCISMIPVRRIDVLVNSAGTAFKAPGIDPDERDYHRIFDLNLLAPIYMVSALRDKLSGGLVINISSTSDRIPEQGYALYCSSKAALNMYFDVVALEQKTMKIINILPDYVDTPLLRKEVGDTSFDWSSAAKPEQVAEFIESLINNNVLYSSGSRIMIVTNATSGSFTRKEMLFAYNVDTNQFID